MKKKTINFMSKNSDFIFFSVFIITVIIILYSNGISGNDFCWHIKAGSWICQNKEVPTKDIFSWIGIENNIDWTAHEWASEVIFYQIYNNYNELGIWIFSIISLLLSIYLIYLELNKKNYIKNYPILTYSFLILYTIIGSKYFYCRPQIFSYFFLFFTLKILFTYIYNPNTKIIYFIPLISCLWSNFHGGSSMLIYILCFIFFILSLFDINYGRLYNTKLKFKDSIRLFFVFLSSIFAIFINPIGIKVFLYPYSSMGDKVMINNIIEWFAPDIKEISILLLFFIPILISVLLIISCKRKINIIDLIILLLFLYLFLRSTRFIMFYFIAISFFIFKYKENLVRKKLYRKNYGVGKGILIISFAILFIPSSIISIQKLNKDNILISKELSIGIITEIKQNDNKRIFNDYNIGGDLIKNDIQPFYDSRADLYKYNNILTDGINIERLTVNIDEMIDKYQYDSFVTKNNSPLNIYLSSHIEKYKLIYSDNKYNYFKLN